MAFEDLGPFGEISTMEGFSDEALDLGLDVSIVDFIFEEYLGSQFKEGLVLEEDLSLGFGSLRAIIFFLIIRDCLLECRRRKRIKESKRQVCF